MSYLSLAFSSFIKSVVFQRLFLNCAVQEDDFLLGLVPVINLWELILVFKYQPNVLQYKWFAFNELFVDIVNYACSK